MLSNITKEELFEALEAIITYSNIDGWCSWCRYVYSNIEEHEDDCPVKKAFHLFSEIVNKEYEDVSKIK